MWTYVLLSCMIGVEKEMKISIYTVTDRTHWQGRSVFWVAAL